MSSCRRAPAHPVIGAGSDVRGCGRLRCLLKDRQYQAGEQQHRPDRERQIAKPLNPWARAPRQERRPRSYAAVGGVQLHDTRAERVAARLSQITLSRCSNAPASRPR